MGQSTRFTIFTHAIPITVLSLSVFFTSFGLTPAIAQFISGSGPQTFTKQSSSVRGITEMCVAAAGGISRQPEKDKVILEFVREGAQKIVYKKDEEVEGVEAAIGIIRAAAIEAVARQPEAEKKILGLLEECEVGLKLLQGKRYKY